MAETWVSMAELTELVGAETARRLSVARGGVPFYVPQAADPGHFLAGIAGVRGMAVLCSRFGGERITVPNGRKADPHKAAVLRELARGGNPAEIAMALGVTERYVYALAADMARAGNRKKINKKLQQRLQQYSLPLLDG
jgi:hypothetical protein